MHVLACSFKDLTRAHLQAGVTDNTPVHVLGGSVVPIGQPGSMTTATARASPLTLLVALAPANASRGAQRCAGPCAVPQVLFQYRRPCPMHASCAQRCAGPCVVPQVLPKLALCLMHASRVQRCAGPCAVPQVLS